MSDSKGWVSYLVRAAAWAAVLAVLFLAWMLHFVLNVAAAHGGIDFLLFLGFAGLAAYIFGGIFLAALIPSAIRYCYTRKAFDLTSLYLAGGSLLVVLIEFIVFRGIRIGGSY